MILKKKILFSESYLQYKTDVLYKQLCTSCYKINYRKTAKIIARHTTNSEIYSVSSCVILAFEQKPFLKVLAPKVYSLSISCNKWLFKEIIYFFMLHSNICYLLYNNLSFNNPFFINLNVSYFFGTKKFGDFIFYGMPRVIAKIH